LNGIVDWDGREAKNPGGMGASPRQEVIPSLRSVGIDAAGHVLWVDVVVAAKNQSSSNCGSLLSAFAKHGSVQHEPDTYSVPIDLLFESPDGDLRFAADIAAIFEWEMHRRNPVDRFHAELSRRITQAKIGSGRFSFRIEEEQPIASRGTGKKRQLLLPPINQFSTYLFTNDFNGFIERVRTQPHAIQHHVIRCDAPAVNITIEYSPGETLGFLSQYGAYASTTVKDNNPLFNALKRKAEQLRRSGYEGLRGVIICDGGAQILNETPNWAIYSIREVVRDFFRQNASVAFVITIAIKWKWFNSNNARKFEYIPQLFVRDATPQQWAHDLGRILDGVMSSVPEPSQTPENAISQLKWNRSTKITRPYCGGGWQLQGNEVKISARELLDFLAGKINPKQFAEDHAVGDGNMFRVFRDQGKMIRRIWVERQPDKDDDWIVIQFSTGDPAVCDFKVPEVSEQSESWMKDPFREDSNVTCMSGE
jgi:hypothetical protein